MHVHINIQMCIHIHNICIPPQVCYLSPVEAAMNSYCYHNNTVEVQKDHLGRIKENEPTSTPLLRSLFRSHTLIQPSIRADPELYYHFVANYFCYKMMTRIYNTAALIPANTFRSQSGQEIWPYPL